MITIDEELIDKAKVRSFIVKQCDSLKYKDFAIRLYCLQGIYYARVNSFTDFEVQKDDEIYRLLKYYGVIYSTPNDLVKSLQEIENNIKALERLYDNIKVE